MLKADVRMQFRRLEFPGRLTVVLAAVVGVAATLGAHDPISTKVTWEREIGPLVQARCVSCHSPGGRAPMPLTTYEEARPWARAIREEVLTRRMPKWPVVRGYGDFRNDPSLSPFEIALFAAWADGGAPAVLRSSAGTPGTPNAVAGTPGTANALASRPVTANGAVSPLVGSTFRSGAHPVDIPCSSRALPPGRVLGLRPMLDKGADLRVIVTHADGTQEPLLWLRRFDPEFADTYWLRTPLTVTRATRVSMDSATPCRVSVLLEAKTAQ